MKIDQLRKSYSSTFAICCQFGEELCRFSRKKKQITITFFTSSLLLKREAKKEQRAVLGQFQFVQRKFKRNELGWFDQFFESLYVALHFYYEFRLVHRGKQVRMRWWSEGRNTSVARWIIITSRSILMVNSIVNEHSAVKLNSLLINERWMLSEILPSKYVRFEWFARICKINK